MAYGNKSKPSKIYSYKCKSPRLNAGLVAEQMSLAHRYRNDRERGLVRIELDRRLATTQALQQNFPLLEQAEQRVAQLVAEIEQLRTAIKARNAAERKRQRSGPEHVRIAELAAEQKLVRAQIKEQREAIWDSQSAVAKLLKEDRGGGKMRWNPEMVQRAKQALGHAQLSASGHAFACALLDLELAANDHKRELRANCGVYWGSYLAVENTVKRTGKPPKFHRWTGDGKLAVQIQSGKPMSTEGLFGTDSRLQLELEPLAHGPAPTATGHRSRRPYVRARFRIGTQENGRDPLWCDTLVTLHRPLPPGQVQWAYLIRRRVGCMDRWELQFVVAREEGWAHEDNATTGTVGIDVGWRLLPNGDLRVAYWAGDDGREGQLVIPAERLLGKDKTKSRSAGVGWLKPTEVQSTLDDHRNRFLDQLRAWLADGPALPDWWAERAVNVSQWRSVYRLRNLCWFWRDHRFPADQSIYSAVEFFTERARHLIQWQRHQERKLTRWRTQYYRRVLAILRRQYHTAVIENCNFRELQATPLAEEADERSPLKLWRVAAVGDLHRLIKEAFTHTEEVRAAGTTSIHNACGQPSGTSAPRSLHHFCSQSCLVWFDQDQNAAYNLRDAIVSGPASGPVVAKTP